MFDVRWIVGHVCLFTSESRRYWDVAETREIADCRHAKGHVVRRVGGFFGPCPVVVRRLSILCSFSVAAHAPFFQCPYNESRDCMRGSMPDVEIIIYYSKLAMDHTMFVMEQS